MTSKRKLNKSTKMYSHLNKNTNSSWTTTLSGATAYQIINKKMTQSENKLNYSKPNSLNNVKVGSGIDHFIFVLLFIILH